MPRGVLVDLESGVLNGIKSGPMQHFFNPENIYMPANLGGEGAGNVWGKGWDAGAATHNEIFDVIDREADGCDSLEVCLLLL